jgi:hypothetical protein
LTAFSHAKNYATINKYSFINIDPPSRYSDVINKKKSIHKLSNSGQEAARTEKIFDLIYTSHNDIVNYFDSIALCGIKNIILDISCMPKRFFFPFIKRLLKHKDHIDNLIITNTIPKKYTNEPLSESYEEWLPLPLFAGDNYGEQIEIVLLGVGHLPMGSPEPIRDMCESSKIQLYFPFPGTPHSLDPTWNFVHRITRAIGNHEKIHITRIGARDVSELFNFLENDTQNGQKTSILVPCGPKSFSLAMALFACKYDRPVYYTQPKVYHPDYSIGISESNGIPMVLAYSIIANGRLLYI